MSLDDKAQEHEAQEWSINNRPREVTFFHPSEKGYGPSKCTTCGADMHPVRRADGRKLCTSCQQHVERASRRPTI